MVIDMLKEKFNPACFKERFCPFPDIDDRAFWDSLPGQAGYVAAAEEYLKTAPPALPASLYRTTYENGDRVGFETPYFLRRTVLTTLLLAECLENKGRFTDAVIDYIVLILEELTWSIPAHTITAQNAMPDVTDPVVELFSAETAAMLAVCSTVFAPRLSGSLSLIQKAIGEKITNRILIPYLKHEHYGWLGNGGHKVNNWNAWINSNMLYAALLSDCDSETRVAVVKKAFGSLDVFITGYPADGGCDEGPTYWGVAAGAMHEFLQLVFEVSGGEISLYDEKLIQNMCGYIAKLYIADDYFAAIADTPARIDFEYGLVYDFAKMTGDKNSLNFALQGLSREVGENTNLLCKKPARAIRQLIALRDSAGKTGGSPFPSRQYLPGLQIVVLREKVESSDGFYLAAKGGHNDESHNHNDIGSFLLFHNVRPVLIDAGVEHYNMKSFSPERYTIWNMRSDWHNLPDINGQLQKQGVEHGARDAEFTPGDETERFNMDIAPAYPKEAGIERYIRSFAFTRAGEPIVEITDAFYFEKPDNEITFNFITPQNPLLHEGKIGLGSVFMHYPAGCQVVVERFVLKDVRMMHSWGEALYRIKLTFTGVRQQKTFTFRFGL